MEILHKFTTNVRRFEGILCDFRLSCSSDSVRGSVLRQCA
jgi:hypothetical protein